MSIFDPATNTVCLEHTLNTGSFLIESVNASLSRKRKGNPSADSGSSSKTKERRLNPGQSHDAYMKRIKEAEKMLKDEARVKVEIRKVMPGEDGVKVRVVEAG